MPAPENNQNAAKPDGEKADSFLHIKCRGEDKGCWKAMAQPGDVSKWVVRALNALVPDSVRSDVRQRYQQKISRHKK